jgi:hypothetical protein
VEVVDRDELIVVESAFPVSSPSTTAAVKIDG